LKEYTAESIRNIAFIGHGGSGKTTLSEILLYQTNQINRIGNINEGNTVSDYSPNEIEKQISISTSLLHLEWNHTKINVLDTPGYTDFIGEVKAAMRVCDTAVMVLKSAEGVEVGSETTGTFINEYGLPSAIIINKIDNEHSHYKETEQQAKNRLSSGAIIVTFPANEGINFDTVVDVIKMKAYTYGAPGTRSVIEKDVPDSLKSQAEAYRTELIEKVAETTEDLMNKYFENGSLTEDELKLGLKQSIIKRNFTPVFALSASKGVGLNNFLEFVSLYFPSPADRVVEEGMLKGSDKPLVIKPDDKGEPVLFIFLRGIFYTAVLLFRLLLYGPWDS